MRLKISSDIETLLDLIRSELNSDQEMYLVGGAVRDVLLKRKLHDLDFVMSENPKSLAKRIANRLDAGFFMLDDDRHTARVVHHDSEGNPFPLDFVSFTGENLIEDLNHRDFTINAMAVSIRNTGEVIDPLSGQADLKKKRIRACSSRALLDDPVRVLRSIRLAMDLDFEYASGLEALMVDAAGVLPDTSYERQRDEFFKILEGPKPSLGMAHCRQYRVFDTLIPPLTAQAEIPASPPHILPLFDHSIDVVERYHFLLHYFFSDTNISEDMPWWLSHVFSELQEFIPQIMTYFNEEITPGRTKRGLALLGALLHDIGKPSTRQIGDDGRIHYDQHGLVGADLAWAASKRMQLSNAESEWVRTLVWHHMRPVPLVKAESLPNRRAIYRYFQDTGEVGVAIALHSLADVLSTYGNGISKPRWYKGVAVTRSLLSAWWEQKEAVVSPQPLLDGTDLQKKFGLKPGKQIGVLLETLVEAQASGEVITEDDAVLFIQEKLISHT